MVLKVDPFTPNAPIDDPARFAGRETELTAIVDALFQTANGNPHHVAITGARGIGKTSALHMAARIAEGDRSLLDRLGIDTGEFAFNMLSVVHTATRGETVEDVVNALLDRLRHALQQTGFKTNEIHWQVDLKLFKVGGSSGPGVIPHVVDQLIDRIEKVSQHVRDHGMNGLLLMVDEVDRVTRIAATRDARETVHAGFGSFFKVLSEKLAVRGLKQTAICVCGVEGFLQELKQEHASIERVFRDVPIPPLTDAQAEQIIVSALGRVIADSDEPARRRIVKLSGGYPEPVHLIGSEAFRVDVDDFIDTNDVEAALDQVVKYIRRNYLKDLIARAGSGRDQEILRAMAGLEGEIRSVQQIGEAIGVPPYKFGSNMTRLTRRHILTRQSKGQYRFTEPLLEIYIRRVGIGSAEDDELETAQ
jgi:hypothetical protein